MIENRMHPDLPPLAVSMGEPSGIGPEIILRAWLRRRDAGMPPFFAVAPPGLLAARARRFGLDCPIGSVEDPGDATAMFADRLPVFPVRDAVADHPGHADPATADIVTAAIATAVDLALSGKAAGVVTAPIQKNVLAAAGFAHPGHTEYLAALTAGAAAPARPVMMLAAGGFRVVPLTVHIALRDVARTLSIDMIRAKGMVTADALRRDFGIASPRLAVAGLNPHAGESGEMGDEEQTVIAPAVAALRHAGIDVKGPLSADTLFHAEARARYDAVLCMYHDQALIPLKTVDFWGGVNVTLGLPIVRTSPDHGTAPDIAASGRANPASMIAALCLARDIALNRRQAAATAP